MDLLPLKYRLDFFAITLFHKIIHNRVAIKLPTYITLGQPTNLRFSHKDPLSFVCLIKPRIIRKSSKLPKTIKNKGSKGVVNIPKISCKKVVNRKKKKSTFKIKRYKRENIFRADMNKIDPENFTESKVFKNSFFYKTHLQWNNLPLELRIIEEYEKFSIMLKKHFWDSIEVYLNKENDIGCPDTSIT